MGVLRLMALFLRVGALNELQYRANFFLQLIQSGTALATGLVGLALVFSHTTDLAGWSRAELLAVMGVHTLMGGFITSFIQPNMTRLMDDIQRGTLDYALTKPEDGQVLISVREFQIWQLVNVALGAIVVVYAVLQLRVAIGLAQALAFAATLVLGGLMIYSFWLILTSTAFWVVRVDNMIQLFEGFYQAGRWPVGIYPGWLRSLLTFLVPLAFAITVPAEALTGRLTPAALLAAALLAGALFAVARWVWLSGLRRYSGASA